MATGAIVDGEHIKRLLEVLDLGDPRREGKEPRNLHLDGCGAIHFEKATFVEKADFRKRIFPGPVYFDAAQFQYEADFRQTRFADHADFDNVTFTGPARFRGSVFDDHAGFQHAAFEEDATFTGAKFRSYVDLEDASFAKDTSFEEATFQLARQIGPFTVQADLNLDRSVFDERVALEASAEHISARATVFADGARLYIERATVDLERADLGRAPTLAGRYKESAPILLTLSGAQVAGLSLSGVDLKECCFFRAHGLEALKIEPNCTWRRTPPRHRCIDREMLAEEYHWRCRSDHRRHPRLARAFRGARWAENEEELDPSLGPEHLDADQLADLYRALRKAREDNKDHSGAADLYYGEMEMRRRTPTSGARGRLREWAEKSVIAGYWLIAGYGLRASRSLAALATLIVLAAVALHARGFIPPKSFLHSLLFAAQSSLTLVRPPQAKLSHAGSLVELTVRVLGPILVGLTALSFRSRIKR